ncbi:hypothetical protein QTP88_014126 [Uroleucon formosanum]
MTAEISKSKGAHDYNPPMWDGGSHISVSTTQSVRLLNIYGYFLLFSDRFRLYIVPLPYYYVHDVILLSSFIVTP